MNTVDLNRSLERTLLSKSSHDKRLKIGSSIQLQLELEEKNQNHTRHFQRKTAMTYQDLN